MEEPEEDPPAPQPRRSTREALNRARLLCAERKHASDDSDVILEDSESDWEIQDSSFSGDEGSEMLSEGSESLSPQPAQSFGLSDKKQTSDTSDFGSPLNIRRKGEGQEFESTSYSFPEDEENPERSAISGLPNASSLLYVVEKDFALTHKNDDEESEVGSSELEDLLFGLGERPRANQSALRKKKKRKKRQPYARHLHERVPTKRRSAATPAQELSGEAALLMQRANNAFLDEAYDKATDLLKEVIKLAPGAHDPFHLMGLIYETVHVDLKKAINSYLIAASILKTDVSLWKRVGQLARKIGCNDLAIYCYRRVVPGRKPPEACDEIVTYEIACLYLDRLDYQRAAIYFEKLLARHPGDVFLSMETSKCLYNLGRLSDTRVILTNCLSFMLSVTSCMKLEIQRPGTVGAEMEDIFETLDWPVVEMLTSIMMEQADFDNCLKTLTVILEDKFSTDTITDLQDILSQNTSVPVRIVVRLATASVRSGHPDNVPLVDIAVKLLLNLNSHHPEQSMPDNIALVRQKLFGVLADSFLEAGEPERALKIYEMVQNEHSAVSNTEFWIKAAKCYMQLRDYEKAASFLESVLPSRKPGGGKPKTDSASIASRVRDVEARLLLFEVLSKLSLNGRPNKANGAYKSQHSLTGFSEVAAILTNDHRIQSLIVGSSMMTVPDPIKASERQLIVLRLSVALRHISLAETELVCQNNVADWLKDKCVDSLTSPKVDQRTIQALLPNLLRTLFEGVVAGSSISDGGILTKTGIWNALSEDDLDEELSSDRPKCIECGHSLCEERINRFLQIWRCLWIAEFVLIVRDSTLDTRRVLHESSRNRADTLCRHLAKENGFLDDRAMDFATLSNVYDTVDRLRDDDLPTSSRPTSSHHDSTVSPHDDAIILRTRPKLIESEFRRRLQRYSQGGLSNKLLFHAKLREQLGLASLEDLLGWNDFYYCLENGSRLMLKEGLGRLAVELLEGVLVCIRYSRANKNINYAIGRTLFKSKLKRLSLRISYATNLMRVALSAVRIRFLLPFLRKMLQQRPSVDPTYEKALGRGLFIYATLLFTEGFAHHAAKSISASKDRDIISFNRAWCTRHLMDFPHNFGLTMMVGHYCLLSMRWPYAVAEYTRAVHLQPTNAVAALCLATSTLSFSTSRRVHDRHQVVLRGYAALKRFARLRRAQLKSYETELEQFAVWKTRAVVEYGMKGSNPEAFRARLIERLRAENHMTIANPSPRELAEAVTNTVMGLCTVVSNFFKVYADCAESYNFARAFHHLSLEYLAVPLYQKIIDSLKPLIDSALEVIPLLLEQSRVLLVARNISPPTASTLGYLSQTAFPPALDTESEYNIAWPNQERLSQLNIRSSLAQEILLCQLFLGKPLDEHNNNPIKIDPLEEKSGLEKWLIPNASAESMETVITTTDFTIQNRTNPTVHPMQGLFKGAEASNDHEVRERQYCVDLLKMYRKCLPPGLHLVAVDTKQLLYASAINLSNVARAGNFMYARHVQTANIVWKD